MRERIPELRLIVCADDDARTAGNPGLTSATEAARAVGGRVAVPDFGENRPEGATDFNDLHLLRGAEEVRVCIDAASSETGARASPIPGEAEDMDATMRRLAALLPIDYDRAREAEAQSLGVRVSTLDAEVQKTRVAMDPSGGASIQGQAVMFDDPEPWPDEVDGAEVLNGTSDTLTRHLGQPDGAADAMALWVAHAHCHMAFLHSPRLNITAPEKGCGKTLTLDVLSSLVPKAIRTEGITTAVLFRIVDKYAPTLLVDEYDAFIHDNEELRGAFNAGHKRGGLHLRCEGGKNEVRL